MGWGMMRSYDAQWKSATASAQSREDAIRAPGRIPKDEFWQPGEWAQWLEVEKKLVQERDDALRTRDDKILGKVEEVIKNAYTPEDGQKLSEAALGHVARSIAIPLMVYGRLPIGLMAVTDEEKNIVTTQFKRAERELHYGPSHHDEKKDDFRNWDWKTVHELLISRSHWQLQTLGIEREDFDRLAAAKTQKKSTVDALAQEIKLDAQDVKVFSAIVQDLRKFGDNKHLKKLAGAARGALDPEVSSPQREFFKGIDSLRKEQWFTSERAQNFKDYFDSEEKIRVFVRYAEDPEWSAESETLQSESEILVSLAANPDFLGQWLDLVCKEADAEKTKVVRDVNEKLATLYSKGRKALADLA